MAAASIETDYLVVGAGAMGMAFVDTLLDEGSHRVVMVDRRHQPGGQWLDAYPFVRLHQPSAFYGVGSRELGRKRVHAGGLNAGLFELAGRGEILDYYEAVMRERFLPTGRVEWLGMAEYRREPDGRHVVRSLLDGRETEIVVRRRLVDATLTRPELPSRHVPSYAIGPGVRHLPINALPELDATAERFCVIGGGKTGMDACLWLLGNRVSPDRLRWIVPRDPWLLDRSAYQPWGENFHRTTGSTAAHLRAMVDAASVPELFRLLEERGVLLRLDPAVEPRTYRCATIAPAELDALRRIQDVVRLGHVRSIGADRLELDGGTLPVAPGTVHVDCSAAAIRPAPDRPVFDGDRINLLKVRWCQTLFSAALIAFCESRFADDGEKNALCGPVPSPEIPFDWLRMWLATLRNMRHWEGRPEVASWIANCRLDHMNAVTRDIDRTDPLVGREIAALKALAPEAARKLAALVAAGPPA